MPYLVFLLLIFLTSFSLEGKTYPRIAVFCGGSDCVSESLKNFGYNLGLLLGANNYGLLTGGGDTGLMKEVVDGYISTSSNKEHLFGAILQKYAGRESAYHSSLEDRNLICVESLHKRMEYFQANAEAFMVLPGGFGTLHELIDCLIHNKHAEKPIVVLNLNGLWDPLLLQFEQITKANPTAKSNLKGFVVATSLEEGLALLSEANVCNNGEMI